jgi:hypothetical protein
VMIEVLCPWGDLVFRKLPGQVADHRLFVAQVEVQSLFPLSALDLVREGRDDLEEIANHG